MAKTQPKPEPPPMDDVLRKMLSTPPKPYEVKKKPKKPAKK
jgi:hypothetical protein